MSSFKKKQVHLDSGYGGILILIGGRMNKQLFQLCPIYGRREEQAGENMDESNKDKSKEMQSS